MPFLKGIGVIIFYFSVVVLICITIFDIVSPNKDNVDRDRNKEIRMLCQ